MSGKTLIISLRCGEKLLNTVEFSPGDAAITIGRSHSCALRTPEDDHSVSKTHASIFWKESCAYIEDCGSTNGVFVDGKRISKPVKLKAASIYGLGSCRLVISRMTAAERRAEKRCHRLEFLSGNRAHELVEIRPRSDSTGGAFTIGLEPSNDIELRDGCVSRRHVAITVKRDGSCWIKDLGSSNGTYVNGERLSGRERYLNNGDKISIAYYDFRFLHKDTPTPINWRVKLVVLVILGILIATGVVVHEYILKPTAASFRKQALAYAAAENFIAASNAVEKAYSARHGDAERLQNDALAGQIRIWTAAHSGWEKVISELEAGKVAVVKKTLDGILSENGGWTWNDTTALQMRSDAEFAADLIRRIYDASDVNKARDGDVRGRVVAELDRIDRYLVERKPDLDSRPYLTAAVRNFKTLRGNLSVLLDGLRQVDDSLDSIDRSNPDFSAAAKSLEAVAESQKLNESIRAYAEELLPVCRQFMKVREFLDREFACVTDMDFEGAYALRNKLPLPSKDVCARHAVFSDARTAYLQLHEAYQKEVDVLAPIVRNLDAVGVRDGEMGALIRAVTSSATWDKVLSFDCFKARFPLASRLDPTSVYDEICGIESTYDGLRNLPKVPGRQGNVRMKFEPKVKKVREIFEQVRTFMRALETPQGQAFQSGKLGRLYAVCAKIMDLRSKLIDDLRTRRTRGLAKGAQLSRDRIVAGYYAEYFSDKTSYADLRALEGAFRTIERQMNALGEKYERESDPEKQLRIRKAILDAGLPGGESVRKRWVEACE